MRLDTMLRPLFLGCALLLTPLLMGANGGGCGTVTIGGDGGASTGGGGSTGGDCLPADCGPEPMVAMMCGTSVGPSAICQMTDTKTCGWVFPSCPAPNPCADETLCGAQPHSVILCADGTSVGPTCVADTGGTCTWQAGTCPTPAVCSDKTLCGPAMGLVTTLCADGSTGGNTGRCLETGPNTCAWEIRTCPTTPVLCSDKTLCGPQMGMPTILCADGSTGGNTGRCLDNGDNTCSWEIRTCPVADAGTPGDCRTDADCVAGERCAFNIADGCGAAGVCIADVDPNTAACTAYSPGCTCAGEEVSIVCTTYPSGMAGSPIQNTGPCAVDAGK